MTWGDVAAGGDESLGVLWGQPNPAATSWTFQKWVPGTNQIAETATLSQTTLGLSSLLRFTVDPKVGRAGRGQEAAPEAKEGWIGMAVISVCSFCMW